MDIVSDSVLLACHSGRESQFKSGNGLVRFHEWFLRYIPGEGSGREKAPSVVLGEFAGSVGPGRKGEYISGVNRIIDSSVE